MCQVKQDAVNVVLKNGSMLQEVGRPVVTTEPVVVLSQELTNLQRQLAKLQADVDSLKWHRPRRQEAP